MSTLSYHFPEFAIGAFGIGDIGIIIPTESRSLKGASNALCHAPPSVMRRRAPSDRMNVMRGRLSAARDLARLPGQS